MTKRIALLSTLAFSLVLMPGCPTAGSAAVGDWLITYNNLDFGLRLKANGEAEPIPFPSALQPLAGTFTWEVVGTGVVIYQEFANGKTVWAAELVSNTTMAGAWITWAGNNKGATDTWTAFKP